MPVFNPPTDATPNKKHSWVSIHKLRIADYSNDAGLKAHDQHLLLTLCLETSWEYMTYRGTVSDLADKMRSSRAKVTKSLGRLEAEGVIKILDAFGPNRQGELVFKAYEHFIKREKKNGRPPKRAESTPPTGAVFEPSENRVQSDDEVNSNRTPNVRISANDVSKVAESSGFPKNLSKEQQSKGVVEVHEACEVQTLNGPAGWCAQPGCSETISGHTMGDHEPVMPEVHDMVDDDPVSDFNEAFADDDDEEMERQRQCNLVEWDRAEGRA